MASAKAGCDTIDFGVAPHDNLLNGPIFPIYPEIAESLSVPGSYAFKVPGDYRLIDLKQFIIGSFEAYRKHDPAKLEAWGPQARRLDAISESL